MASLTIVSGSPGAGKTTLSSRLAKNAADGLHIPSDVFYSFPAHPINPTRPESRAQNEAIILALGATSAVFLDSGYDVFVDGIIGPWFLPKLLEAVPKTYPVAYLLLTVTEQEALTRVRNREGRGLSAKVQSTRSAFADSSAYENHKVDTTELDAESAYQVVGMRLARGDFQLSR